MDVGCGEDLIIVSVGIFLEYLEILVCTPEVVVHNITVLWIVSVRVFSATIRSFKPFAMDTLSESSIHVHYRIQISSVSEGAVIRLKKKYIECAYFRFCIV